jgi:hypothetical protein
LVFSSTTGLGVFDGSRSDGVGVHVPPDVESISVSFATAVSVAKKGYFNKFQD